MELTIIGSREKCSIIFIRCDAEAEELFLCQLRGEFLCSRLLYMQSGEPLLCVLPARKALHVQGFINATENVFREALGKRGSADQGEIFILIRAFCGRRRNFSRDKVVTGGAEGVKISPRAAFTSG